MKWRVKAALQNLIALMPMSDAIYYAAQRSVGDLRPNRFDPMEWVNVAAEMLAWLKSAGLGVVGKRCLEVGTGRALGVPVALWLCGAEQTVTVDIHRYLSPGLVQECNRYIRHNSARVQDILKNHDEDGKLRDRLQRLCAFSGNVDSLLSLINVDYLAPADARNLPFPDDLFDFHFSYSVFEHVPASEILAILTEARRVLHPQGVLLHTVDLSDHFSYGDSSITRINCLQFSDKQWKGWAGNKYMYHNRLRLSEFLDLFAQAGMSIKRESRTLDQRSLETLKGGFPLHPKFAAMPVDELAVTAMQVMGEFSGEDVLRNGSAPHPVEWKRPR
jgi:SAM-dependent methyltransferase